MIIMSPQSALEEISQYHAPAHILSAAVLALRLNILYNATYIHINVNSRVILMGHCTYSQSQNDII